MSFALKCNIVCKHRCVLRLVIAIAVVNVSMVHNPQSFLFIIVGLDLTLITFIFLTVL